MFRFLPLVLHHFMTAEFIVLLDSCHFVIWKLLFQGNKVCVYMNFMFSMKYMFHIVSFTWQCGKGTHCVHVNHRNLTKESLLHSALSSMTSGNSTDSSARY